MNSADQESEMAGDNFTRKEYGYFNWINEHTSRTGRNRSNRSEPPSHMGLIFNIDNIPHHHIRTYIGNWAQYIVGTTFLLPPTISNIEFIQYATSYWEGKTLLSWLTQYETLNAEVTHRLDTDYTIKKKALVSILKLL